MNKKDLKKKWSKYCDTDKLVDDVAALLDEHHHRNSVHGICVVLDKYFTAKEPLIKLFATSNRYLGDMRIAMKKEFERDMDRNQIYSFCKDFTRNIGAAKMLLKYTDDDGNTVTDYLKTGHAKLDVTKLKQKNIKTVQKKLATFDLYNCATKTTSDQLQEFNWYMEYYFSGLYSSQINQDDNDHGVDLKRGMKTSRAFNKVCAHYGIDKAASYNSLFAKYADMVSGNTRQLYFVISLNPLDYLTMSLGNSWTSCHSIVNRGSGVGGMACGGCVSYMLDATSIITFVVDKLDGPLHQKGKIYRQMYHYNNNMFLQSRLYPQGNDGSTDLYAKFRGFMYDEFTELLNLDKNAWANKIGTSLTQYYSTHMGFHYRDSEHNRSCGIFYPAEKANVAMNSRIAIGSTSYCFYCGEEQESRNRISHASCIY